MADLHEGSLWRGAPLSLSQDQSWTVERSVERTGCQVSLLPRPLQSPDVVSHSDSSEEEGSLVDLPPPSPSLTEESMA